MAWNTFDNEDLNIKQINRLVDLFDDFYIRNKQEIVLNLSSYGSDVVLPLLVILEKLKRNNAVPSSSETKEGWIIDTIVKIGKPAVPFVVEAFVNNKERGFWDDLVFILSAIKDSNTIKLLLNELRPLIYCGEGDRTQILTNALMSYKEAVIPELINLLSDEDLKMANYATRLLPLVSRRITGDYNFQNYRPEIFSFLITSIKSENPKVRATSAWSLGALRFAEAEDILIAMLAGDDFRVLRTVVRSLGKVGGKKSFQALQKLLNDDNRVFSNYSLKKHILASLSRINEK